MKVVKIAFAVGHCGLALLIWVAMAAIQTPCEGLRVDTIEIWLWLGGGSTVIACVWGWYFLASGQFKTQAELEEEKRLTYLERCRLQRLINKLESQA